MRHSAGRLHCPKWLHSCSHIFRCIVQSPPPLLGTRLATSNRAHGVVASHPLRMRKALGSNPSVSILRRGADTELLLARPLSVVRSLFREVITRACGVVVSHPLCMRKALGSIPSMSICPDALTFTLGGCNLQDCSKGEDSKACEAMGWEHGPTSADAAVHYQLLRVCSERPGDMLFLL